MLSGANASDLFSSSVGNCCLDDTLKSTFGDWRTKVTQVADDEENGYFIKNVLKVLGFKVGFMVLPPIFKKDNNIIFCSYCKTIVHF
jgi:hypothetical protein